LNLVPDKVKAFAETYRVLKPGGHFSVSDIVLRGELPEGLRKSAELYAGCVAGAISKNEYLEIIENSGFINIKIQKEKRITLPDEILAAHLSEEEFIRFKSGESGIYSITVYGEKPSLPEEKKAEQKAACCGAESTCC
jgi:SAM-dependent methyltransferase